MALADSPKRVLVTRPDPGASETTRRLESLGFDPIKLPLQETRRVVSDAPGSGRVTSTRFGESAKATGPTSSR